MVDHFKVLGLAPGAKQEDVAAAFEELLADRKARRRKSGDLYAALAVLSDPTLRRAHEIALFGDAAGDKLAGVGTAVVEAVADAIPDIQWSEVRKNAVQTALQTTVKLAGLTAKASDVTGSVSRRIPAAAARRVINPRS